MSQPWMKFFGKDWCGDRALRSCSLGARGLWLEMLLVMSETEPRGSLLVNGRQVDIKKLAGMVGADKKEVEQLFSELDDAGVFSRDADGTVFSRKMRRDEIKAQQDKRSGEMGGHPEIRRGTVPKEERVRRFRRSDAPEKARRIFERSSGKCHWCGKELGEAYHIDHVIAVRDGGGNEEENLVASCPDCNGRRAMTFGPTPIMRVSASVVGNVPNVRVGNPPDPKAQKPDNPEAKGQKESAAQPLSLVRTEAPRPETLHTKCLELVGEEPVSSAQDFVMLQDCVGKDGITEADVIAGVHDAMAKPGFRIKYWESLVGWARKAAQNRLEAKPKSNGYASSAARPDNLDPAESTRAVDMGSGVVLEEKTLVKMIRSTFDLEMPNRMAFYNFMLKDFDKVETFRRGIAVKAPHLMKFWPAESAETPGLEPAK